MIYHFGEFELDQERRQLRRRHQEVVLQPLIFDLLVMLVRNRARVVSKHELLDELWSDVTVTESSLQRAISVARSKLGDRSRQLIRTYTGYGYRFCGKARDDPARSTQAVSAPHRPPPSSPQVRDVRTADGVRIAYWTLGQGPPMVYVPNLIWSHGRLEWEHPEIRRWYQRLVRHRTLIRLDPRGTGASQREVDSYSLPSILRDVEAVVEHLQLERFALFGEINSGPVVMRYAAENPGRVACLVLWHTFANVQEIDGPKMRMIESLQPLMAEDWETYTETRAHMGFGWSDGASAHRYATLLRQCISPDLARRSYEAGRLDDITTLLPRIDAPALVLHRRSFYFWNVEVSRNLAARLGSARLEVLDGVGSAPFLGDFEAVAAAIDRFAS